MSDWTVLLDGPFAYQSSDSTTGKEISPLPMILNYGTYNLVGK
jgi:hypothetical protein